MIVFAVPSVPTNVSIEVTSRYAIVTWMPPANINGILRYYRFLFYDRRFAHIPNHVFRTIRISATATRYLNLTHLPPFTRYSMTLTAVTIGHGAPYEANFTTLEGGESIAFTCVKKILPQKLCFVCVLVVLV